MNEMKKLLWLVALGNVRVDALYGFKIQLSDGSNITSRIRDLRSLGLVNWRFNNDSHIWGLVLTDAGKKLL